MRPIMCFLTILSALMVPQAPSAPLTLDLTVRQSMSDEEVFAENDGEVLLIQSPQFSISTHTPELPQPLKIVGVTFDRTSYRLLDRFVYEVTIKNTGSSPFAVPWSADFRTLDHRVTNADYSRLLATVAIYVLVDGRPSLGSAGEIYGSERIPASIHLVEPGGEFRIRALGVWAGGSQPVALESLRTGKPITVEITYQVTNWPKSRFRPSAGARFDTGTPTLSPD